MTNREKSVIILIGLFIFFGGYVNAQNSENNQVLWTSDWSKNANYIAVGGNVDALKIYSSKNLQLLKSYPIENTITCVKWHPTRKLLAVGTQLSGNKVRIFNFETDTVIVLEDISADGARGIDWNFSGEYLAVADNDGQISVFDINGKLVRKITQESAKSLCALDWHPTKNIFITVGDSIRIYDIEGELLKSFSHRKEETLLLCVAWHSSGDFFVTGDYGDHQKNYNPLLQYWTASGELLKSISLNKVELRNIAWNNKGDRLATASDALRIWDVKGNLLYQGNSKDNLWGLSWNRKGNKIVTSSNEQRIIIWNNKAKKLVTEHKGSHSN